MVDFSISVHFLIVLTLATSLIILHFKFFVNIVYSYFCILLSFVLYEHMICYKINYDVNPTFEIGS